MRRFIDPGLAWTPVKPLCNPDQDHFRRKIDDRELQPARSQRHGDGLLVGAGSDMHALSFASGRGALHTLDAPHLAVASVLSRDRSQREFSWDPFLRAFRSFRSKRRRSAQDTTPESYVTLLRARLFSLRAGAGENAVEAIIVFVARVLIKVAGLGPGDGR